MKISGNILHRKYHLTDHQHPLSHLCFNPEANLTGANHLQGVEQAHSIFYILHRYSNLTLGEGRGEWLLGLFDVSEDGGREQETLYYYSVTWDHYIVII
jgi:hypothetical protein